MFNWLKALWERFKPVLVSQVVKKLQDASPELAKKLGISNGEMDRIIAVIVDYIKRQA